MQPTSVEFEVSRVNYHDVASVAAGLFAAGIIKGVTGIGYATCAMPMLTLAVGLPAAISIVILPALASNAAMLFASRNFGAVFRRFSVFYLGILPGIATGALLLTLVDVRYATRGLAILTLAYVLLAVARPQLSLSSGAARALALPAGVLNGVLTGLTGSQIIPLVPYMLALRLEPAVQAQAINLAVTIASAALGTALLGAGVMTPELLALSAAGILPAVAATWAGTLLHCRLPVDALRRLTLLVLSVVAIGLVTGELADIARWTLAFATLPPRHSLGHSSAADPSPPVLSGFEYPPMP